MNKQIIVFYQILPAFMISLLSLIMNYLCKKLSVGEHLQPLEKGLIRFICLLRLYNGHMVAIKIFNEPLITKKAEIAFSREVHAGMAINHPNCMKIYGWSETPAEYNPYYQSEVSCPIIVMEYAGESLTHYIANHPDMSNQEKQRILLDVAKGLVYLHSKNMVHRDIKVELVEGEE